MHESILSVLKIVKESILDSVEENNSGEESKEPQVERSAKSSHNTKELEGAPHCSR